MKKRYPPNVLLKREREQHNWTQEDLAEKLGLPDPHTVGRWERGVIFPSPRYRRELCRIFGKSMTELGLLKHPQDDDMVDSFEEIALEPSIVRKQWLPLDVAVREVLAFEKLFGTGHFLLACHAALPSLLTPELLHFIRLNFLDQQKTPWIAEMDFLLSPLCRPIERDLFEVEPMVREALLFKLEERYGWPHLQNIADFLLQYVHKNHASKRNAGVTQLHEWIAQAYLQPDKVVQELTHLLTESIDPHSNDYQKLPKKLRIARSMELLAGPLRRTMLQEEYAGLVYSARVLAYTLYGDKATFPTTIRATGSASKQSGTLFPLAALEWLSAITTSQRSPRMEEVSYESVDTTDEGDTPPGETASYAINPTFKEELYKELLHQFAAYHTPDEEIAGAEDRIERMLREAGWSVQDNDAVNVDAARGIAIRDIPFSTGPFIGPKLLVSDTRLIGTEFLGYLLVIDGEAVGVIVDEEEEIIYRTREQTAYHTTLQMPRDYTASFISSIRSPLPFFYATTGFDTSFTNQLEPEARTRRIFTFHRPETLAQWLRQGPAGTPNNLNNLLRSRLNHMPQVFSDEWGGKVQAQVITTIEKALAANHPRVLVQISNGRGKTMALVNIAYRLLAFANAQRILYLVDSRATSQVAYERFKQFKDPNIGSSFTDLFHIQRLSLDMHSIESTINVCITTVEHFCHILPVLSSVENVREYFEEKRTLEEAMTIIRELRENNKKQRKVLEEAKNKTIDKNKLIQESELEIEDEKETLNEIKALLKSIPNSITRNKEILELRYNPAIPIDFFDALLIDDCELSSYKELRLFFEYFDAFVIGTTRNADEQMLSFFNNNLVYGETSNANPKDESLPLGSTVLHRFSLWLASQEHIRPTPFTDEQIRWLERIRDHIETNGKFEEQDFNHPPFEFDGGLVAAQFLFGKELSTILLELNQILGSSQLAVANSLPDPTHTELTPTELKVLRLLAQGLKSAQIAEQLVMSVTTVNFHVRSIYRKLEVTSRAAATRYAIEHDLV